MSNDMQREAAFDRIVDYRVEVRNLKALKLKVVSSMRVAAIVFANVMNMTTVHGTSAIVKGTTDVQNV